MQIYLKIMVQSLQMVVLVVGAIVLEAEALEEVQ